MSLERQEKEQKKRIRGCIIIALIALLIPVLIIVAYNVSNYYRFQHRLEALRAKGLPTSAEEAAKWQVLPDEDNALEAMDDVEMLIDTAQGHWSAYNTGKSGLDSTDIGEYCYPDASLDKSITPDKHFARNLYVKHAEDFKKLMSLYEPLYEKIDALIKYKGLQQVKYCRCDENAGHLMEMRWLVFYLNTGVLYHLHVTGDMDICRQLIGKTCKMSKMPFYDKSMIGKLTALSISCLAAESFQAVLLEQKMDVTNLQKIRDEFAGLFSYEDRFSDYIISERVMALDVFSRLSELGGSFFHPLPFFSKSSYRPYALFVYENTIKYGDMNKLLDFYEALEPVVTEKWKSTNLDFVNSPVVKDMINYEYLYPICSMMTGPVVSAVQAYYKTKALQALSVMAADIAAGLQELRGIPADLSAYPYKDPFTDQPFHIASKGDYIYLYSLGPDQKDSGNWSDIPVGKTQHRDTSVSDEIILRIPKPNGGIRITPIIIELED